MSSALDFFRTNHDLAIVFGMFAVVFTIMGCISLRQVASILDRYKKLPDLTGYLAANPSCKTSSGPTCHVCLSRHFGSRSVHSHFSLTGSPIGRIHYCTKCQNDLYRT